MRRTTPTTRWDRGGTVMVETLMVTPILLFVFVLLFFMGRLGTRVQHAQAMARYESWRQMEQGHDLTSNSEDSYALLDEMFNHGDAMIDMEHWRTGEQGFPSEAMEAYVEAALSGSQETGDLAEALMFTPSGVDVRMSHGHREGFSTTYPQVVRLNFRVTGPVRRAQSRIGNDWALTVSTSAMADTWAGATYRDHHPRAVRDVFYAEFDELLDALDGEGPVEYPSDSASVEAFNNEILAGFIRALYLSRPDYAGPIVYQERPQ